MVTTPKFTRRQFLTVSGLTALSAANACTQATPIPTSSMQPRFRKRVLRIAHMTDFHIIPELKAPAEAARAIRHAQEQADPPDIILNTGDAIMEGLKVSKEIAEAQWQAFTKVIEAECKLPIYHAIGNHDVWGWGITDAQVQSDPL